MAFQQESLNVFYFWSGVLVLKLLSMTVLTARQRFSKKTFANPEDAAGLPNSKVGFNDPDIERIRRAHLNDLENILPWFAITYIWLGTGPSPWLARVLIRSFAASRIIHTIVYAIIPKQPHRALAFFIGFFITGYEAVSTMLYYY
ncbi:microsomal glutathione S-transferase 1 [Orussus abietinus]|uniref:microsomal glutathione S-transferase 1 n=1 Tax=Orussus abietinus TaxID=222816 RepID=UPI000626D062|nr:microsomal glutathione S-transferase 1 [Orussus abietinus]XP_023290499.1 microsomal glutathione S-transferase 1 [Orussus abietinus]